MVVNTRDVKYLTVVDSETNEYNVCVEGECSGPVINATATVLNFYYNPQCRFQKHTIGLENKSDAKTWFHFDLKNFTVGHFRVNKAKGVLNPRSVFYVDVFCDYYQSGVISTQLIALIHNHSPVIITLVAVVDLTKVFDASSLIFKHYDLSNKIGYEEYLEDGLRVRKKKPPISLTHHNLDFGGYDLENPKPFCTLVTSLTNHMYSEVIVDWCIDSEVFSITPLSAKIPAHSCILYECRFKPNEPDGLYEAIVSANIQWLDTRNVPADEQCINVPITAFIRFTGHSFPDGKTWIPNVETIPETVILPGAVPKNPEYTTFMMKNKSTLPVSYKLIPPKITHFTVKPKIGVFLDYQILVAQLQPDSWEPKDYNEIWFMELDGRHNQLLPIELKGYSEQPAVVVGDKNEVVFETAFPESDSVCEVPIENISRHYVLYKLITTDDRLRFQESEGTLKDKEKTVLKWYCTGKLDAPEEINVTCQVMSYKNFKEHIGYITEISAIPDTIDCFTIPIRTRRTVTFILRNDGESVVNFILDLLEVFDLEQAKIKEVTLKPMAGSIHPNTEISLDITINATYRGFHKYIFYYEIKTSEESHKLATLGLENKILELTYFVEYPTLQITDIYDFNFGKVISKYFLWNILNIESLNKVLKEINDDETKRVEMYFPDVQEEKEGYTIRLTVKNTTEFDTEWSLKRVKLCDCKRIEKAIGLSFVKASYDCIHREMFEMSLSNPMVKGKFEEYLTIKITYLQAEQTKMQYILTLPKNRCIEITCTFTGLGFFNTKLSAYSNNSKFKLDMKPVFIGEKDPSDQVFWLYNGTQNEVHYAFDDRALKDFNDMFRFEILKCVNPEGTLQPQTRKPILFKFTPIEMRLYMVSVPLWLGEDEKTLQITAEGVVNYSNNIYKSLGSMAPYNSTINLNHHISFSVDHMLVEQMLTWSVVEKTIFIQNITKTQTILYTWEDYMEEGIISASFDKIQGVLEPSESQAIVITLKSYNEACLVQIILNCTFFDYTEYMLYIESVNSYKVQKELFADYFTITEKGTEYPECTVKILPKPEPFCKNMTLSCQIISSKDRDLKIPVKEQFKQSSKRLILSDAEKLVNKIRNVDFFKDKTCCDCAGDNRVQDVKIKSNVENFAILKNTTQAILWDAVMSDAFAHVIKITEPAVPFYHQIKMHSGKTVNVEKVKHKEILETGLKYKRLQYHIQRPQPEIVTGVFKELIGDALHDAFQLGPRQQYHMNELVCHEQLIDAQRKLLSKNSCIC